MLWQVFNRDGELVRTIGSEGTEPGQFKNPHAVAVDATGNVVVADFNNNRVQILH